MVLVYLSLATYQHWVKSSTDAVITLQNVLHIWKRKDTIDLINATTKLCCQFSRDNSITAAHPFLFCDMILTRAIISIWWRNFVKNQCHTRPQCYTDVYVLCPYICFDRSQDDNVNGITAGYSESASWCDNDHYHGWIKIQKVLWCRCTA